MKTNHFKTVVIYVIAAIFVFLGGFVACTSDEDVLEIQDEASLHGSRTEGPYENDWQPIKMSYQFVNVLLNEPYEVVRHQVTEHDILLMQNVSPEYMDSVIRDFEEKYDVDEIENLIEKQRTIFIAEIGEDRYARLENYVRTYIKKGNAGVKGLGAPGMFTTNELHAYEQATFLIDDVMRPYMFNDCSSDRIPQTHQECYDQAVEDLKELGLSIVIDTVISLGSNANPIYGFYTAIRLYKIYWDFDDCLERIYSHN